MVDPVGSNADAILQPAGPTPYDPSQGNNLTALVNTLQNSNLLSSKLYTILQTINATLAGVLPAASVSTGTWTPGVAFGGVSTGITGTFAGTYTAIGREVLCRFTMVLTSKGAATGSATITGLPFAANADATNAGSGGLVTAYSNMSGLTGQPVIQGVAGASAFNFTEFGAAASAPISNSGFTNTSTLDGFFGYFK